MEEDGPRLNKLKLVFKKAIQEVLKEEERAREILADQGTPACDSFFGDGPDKTGCGEGVWSADDINRTVREVFSSLKTRLSGLFMERVAENDIGNKLNRLDREISENRGSLKDITSEDYIEEILESYIVDPKVEYIDHVERLKRESLERTEMLRTELERISNETRLLREENEVHGNSYNKLVSDFLDAVESKYIC